MEEGVEGFGGNDGGDCGFRAEFAVVDDALECIDAVAGDFEFEEEAVELGFREGVGAFEFDGVLCGEDEEGGGKVVGLAEDCDAALLHGFEEGGLSFGGGAVDFVSEDDVCEEGTGLKNEFAATVDFLENRVSGDVPREEVRGELDAFVI